MFLATSKEHVENDRMMCFLGFKGKCLVFYRNSDSTERNEGRSALPVMILGNDCPVVHPAGRQVMILSNHHFSF